MRLILKMAAVAALSVSGTAAFAWGDMYMGDATNNPNSNMMVHSYGGENYCPAGLQPVYVGGMICCGTPNAGPYINRSGGHKKVKRKMSRPAAYAPVGAKGVVYR
ncbi:MAG: hypothetical protein N4A70_00955 [Pelagimonas sp.]|nr:hypothetical protein [Pelagimonas sp.]